MNRGLYCSRKCANRATKPARNLRGPAHPNWKGGRSVGRDGGVSVLMPDGTRMAEHRLVMEQHVGRKLLPVETVHHGPRGRSCNEIENLELWTSRHPKGQRVTDLVEFAVEILALYAPERLRA